MPPDFIRILIPRQNKAFPPGAFTAKGRFAFNRRKSLVDAKAHKFLCLLTYTPSAGADRTVKVLATVDTDPPNDSTPCGRTWSAPFDASDAKPGSAATLTVRVLVTCADGNETPTTRAAVKLVRQFKFRS